MIIYKVVDTGVDGRANQAIAHFTHREDAEEISKGKRQQEIYEVIAHETLQEFKDWSSGEVKARALRKLTPEERAALGYK